MKNRSVLFVLPGNPAPIGGFKLLYEHGKILKKSGICVKFIHINGGLYPEISGNTFLFYKLTIIAKFFYGKYFGKWRNYVRDQFELSSCSRQTLRQKNIDKADVICIASWQLLNHITDNYNLSLVKVIHPVMDYPGYMGPKEKILESWSKSVKYLCISDYLYNSFINYRSNASVCKIGCMLTGIDNSSIVESSFDQKNIKKSILLSYSTGKYKNAKGTLKVIDAVVKSFPKEEVIVFGRPKRPADLHNSVQYVHNPTDNQVTDLYISSSLFIFFSDFEGFGLMPLEAMLHNTPVICTDCFGNRDYIADQINSLVVSPGDIFGVLSMMKSIFESDALRESLIKNGLKTAESYLPKHHEAIILKEYTNV
jgi:glycosyltransferase involved in cell wall biosynthesis